MSPHGRGPVSAPFVTAGGWTDVRLIGMRTAEDGRTKPPPPPSLTGTRRRRPPAAAYSDAGRAAAAATGDRRAVDRANSPGRVGRCSMRAADGMVNKRARVKFVQVPRRFSTSARCSQFPRAPLPCALPFAPSSFLCPMLSRHTLPPLPLQLQQPQAFGALQRRAPTLQPCSRERRF